MYWPSTAGQFEGGPYGPPVAVLLVEEEILIDCRKSQYRLDV